MRLQTALAAILTLALATAAAGTNDLRFGGYVPSGSQEADTVAMARKAVDLKNLLAKGTKFKLWRVRKSAVQTVAGKNFKLCLAVRQGKRKFNVDAIVYRDLSGAVMLMRWHEDGC